MRGFCYGLCGKDKRVYENTKIGTSRKLPMFFGLAKKLILTMNLKKSESP